MMLAHSVTTFISVALRLCTSTSDATSAATSNANSDHEMIPSNYADIVNTDTLIDDVVYRECLGELYYRYQLKERSIASHVFSSLGATFPCVYGVFPIGTSTAESANDGHKFTCGLHDIAGEPIVYSFGSHKQVDFEVGMLNARGDARVFTFELDPEYMFSEEEQAEFPRVKFFNIGLGYPSAGDKKPLKSLSEIMQMLGHSYIDVIKMDIDGAEFPFLAKESHLLRRVGQIVIEIHANGKDQHTVVEVVKIFETNGMRLWFKEINKLWHHGCEMSFIQAEWSTWNAQKQLLSR